MTLQSNDSSYSFDNLKQYIADTVGERLENLIQAYGEQSRILRHIEITTTSRLAETELKIQNLQTQLEKLGQEQKSLADSQKLRWKDLAKERDEERTQREQRQLEIAKVFSNLAALNKLLWIFIGIAASLLFGFAWEVFIKGIVR